MSDREARLRSFHAAHPGITSRALARGGSYEKLAAVVEPGLRVLDLGCGDGTLLAALAARGCRPIGIDLSPEELALAHHPVVQARAQALPIATGSIDACVCHLAFMLMDDPPAVVAELARVLVPGGRFAALLGGGPTAGGDDAFHRFLAIAAPALRGGPRLGDPRAKSEAGWRELFAGWDDLCWSRWEIDLAGSFDEVWRFLGASYELDRPEIDVAAIRGRLAAAVTDLTDAEGRVPCRIVTWLGTVRRPHATR